jgi:hypothetical protein
MSDKPKYSTLPLWISSSTFTDGNICRANEPNSLSDTKYIGNNINNGCYIYANDKPYLINQNYEVLNIDPSNIYASSSIPEPLERINIGLNDFNQIVCQTTQNEKSHIGHLKLDKNTCNIAYKNTSGELFTKQVLNNFNYVSLKNPLVIPDLEGCYEGTTQQFVFQGILSSNDCKKFAKENKFKYFIMKNPKLDDTNSVNSSCYVTNNISNLNRVDNNACISNISDKHAIGILSGQDKLTSNKSYSAVYYTENNPKTQLIDENQTIYFEIAIASIATSIFIVFLIFILLWSFMVCGNIESDLNICYKTLICQYTSGERIALSLITFIGILGVILRIVINIIKKMNNKTSKEKEKKEFDKKMKTFSIVSHVMSIPIYILSLYFVYLLVKYKADLSKPCINSLKLNSSTPIVTSNSDYD